MIYDKIVKAHQTLSNEIAAIQAQLTTLPAGKLICARNENRYKWYHSVHSQKSYLPKSKRQLAEQLAQKEYLSLRLKDLLQEKKALEQYLCFHSSEPDHALEFLNRSPEHRKLLSKFFSVSEDLDQWAHASYERNQNYPELLVHKTASGNLVRSKSEALIDMALFTNRVPFRYECMLKLGHNVLYPDFTIRHPKTGKTYYWEHFGQMDKPSYAQKTSDKLQLYISHGIIPNIHLITTYETKDAPLCSDMIDKIISYYFK